MSKLEADELEISNISGWKTSMHVCCASKRESNICCVSKLEANELEISNFSGWKTFMYAKYTFYLHANSMLCVFCKMYRLHAP